MTSSDDQNLRQAYLEGRLLGLSQLVSILKDALGTEEEQGSPLLVKSIVSHISTEMDEIISELKKHHGENSVLNAAEESAKSIEPEQVKSSHDAKKQVQQAVDLMKNLIQMKKEQSGKRQ